MRAKRELGPREKVLAEPSRFFRMYKTILEIIEARGYVVPQQSMELHCVEFFKLFQQGDLQNKREIFPPLEPSDNEEIDPSIAVFFNFCNDAITEEYIKRVIQSAPKIRKFLLIAPTVDTLKNSSTLLDRKAQIFVQELSKKNKDDKEGINVEIFRQEELLFNVLKHDLVPEHRLLTQNQKMVVLQKYKVKESQLPKILLSDPVSKCLGLKRGQVVKILRKSETAGTYTTYRIAI